MWFRFTAEGNYSPRKFRPPSQEYLRATGPKDVHAPQTLLFLPPEEYLALKKLQHSRSTTHKHKGTSANHPITPHKSSLKIHSQDLQSDTKSLRRSQPCNGPTVQYHTHADNVGGHPRNATQLKKGTKFPIRPMNIVDEPTLPPIVS